MENTMNIFELIRNRRSIRQFKPDPIPPDVLDRIMESAIWAPSAMNRQPWKFFILTDEMRDRLASLHQPLWENFKPALVERYGEEGAEKRRDLYHNFAGAPVAIVCFAEVSDGTEKMDIISASLACQNLVLAAWEEGIGSLMMTSSLAMKDEIAFLCGIDQKKHEMVMVILLGATDETPDPPERRRKRIVHVAKPSDIRG